MIQHSFTLPNISRNQVSPTAPFHGWRHSKYKGEKQQHTWWDGSTIAPFFHRKQCVVLCNLKPSYYVFFSLGSPTSYLSGHDGHLVPPPYTLHFMIKQSTSVGHVESQSFRLRKSTRKSNTKHHVYSAVMSHDTVSGNRCVYDLAVVACQTKIRNCRIGNTEEKTKIGFG